MKKGIVILSSIMLLVATVFPTSVFAESEENISPAATNSAAIDMEDGVISATGLPVIYYVSSKTYVKKLNKVFKKDWTPSWAYSREYTLKAGTKYTSKLSVGAEGQIADAVKGSASFVQSRTYSCSVSIHIPADKTRLSKLAHYRDYKQYKALMKYYAGVNSTPVTYGTVTVKEPAADSYNLVRYK